MKKATLIGLTFLFALIAGFCADHFTNSLYHYARNISGDKPMPVLTEWIYRHFLYWGGSLVSIFLIPWAVFLCSVTCSRPADRAAGHCPHCAFLTNVAIFSFAEMLLCLFFGFSCLLPVVPHYRFVMHRPEDIPFAASIPGWILLIVFAIATVVPVIRFIRRRRGSA